MTNTSIHFITGNQNKFKEIQKIIPSVNQLNIDLPEIQSIDPHEVVRAKLQAALSHYQGPFIVEDTSFTVDGLNGLPGPFAKWFKKCLGNEGMVRLAKTFGDTTATARTIIGYAEDNEKITYFEGVVAGSIVDPAGEEGFGWDFIFQPSGHNKTFAQMGKQRKNEISMRRQAAEKLKGYLENE